MQPGDGALSKQDGGSDDAAECDSCGEDVDPDDKFCRNCGEPIGRPADKKGKAKRTA